MELPFSELSRTERKKAKKKQKRREEAMQRQQARSQPNPLEDTDPKQLMAWKEREDKFQREFEKKKQKEAQIQAAEKQKYEAFKVV